VSSRLTPIDFVHVGDGRWGALEVHHILKRAQGGSDFDLDRLVAPCPPYHAQTDAPYLRGRLVVMPSGGGRFIFELWEGTGKETSQVVERWESLWFPITMEPARVRAQSGHHRTNSERNDADQVWP
jgi:hypothetical protein